jgi:lipoate-protein ligase A
VLARAVSSPTLVLGSTQDVAVVDADAVTREGVVVERRRGGGGAVLLLPGDHLWLDAWIPHDDPLWTYDVSAAASWVGQWWTRAFGEVLGLGDLDVHRGRAVSGDLGELVCFAGRGPGEVFIDDTKVVGLSQWRSREGALFSSCAYTVWDPVSLVKLLALSDVVRRSLLGRLRGSAVGVTELATVAGVSALDALREALVASFATFA